MSGNHYPSHKLSEYFLLKKGKGTSAAAKKKSELVVLFQIWTKNNLYILLEGSGYSMSPSLSYTFRMYKCQGIATGKMRKKVRKYFKRGFKRTHQDCTYITALETLNVQADTNDKIASGVILTQIAESEPQPYKEKIISIL